MRDERDFKTGDHVVPHDTGHQLYPSGERAQHTDAVNVLRNVPPSIHDVLHLQGSLGNAATSKLLQDQYGTLASAAVQRTRNKAGYSDHEESAQPAKKRARLDNDDEPPRERIIQQPGYASGDQFGILVALLDDPNMHVLIAKGPEKHEEEHDSIRDKSKDIADFYKESGIKEERIHFVKCATLDKAAVWPTLNHEAYTIARKWGYKEDNLKEKAILGNSAGTEYVAENFSDDTRKKVRDAWKLDSDSRSQEIDKWLKGKGVKLGDSPGKVLVLWSRFSGKAYKWTTLRGRMEHDTSMEGIRQILRSTHKKYNAIIITGDNHPGNKEKWSILTEEMRSELGATNIHNITGFWKDQPDELEKWGGDTRTGQYKLYDYLHTNHTLQHLGFRSGNLEAVALIGHHVRYLEDYGASGGKRMEEWHAQGSEKTEKGGLAPGYERISLHEPATRSGRFSWQYKGKDSAIPSPGERPLQSYFNESGFKFGDLVSILDELDVNAPSRYEFERKRLEHMHHQITNIWNLINQKGIPSGESEATAENALGIVQELVVLIEEELQHYQPSTPMGQSDSDIGQYAEYFDQKFDAILRKLRFTSA